MQQADTSLISQTGFDPSQLPSDQPSFDTQTQDIPPAQPTDTQIIPQQDGQFSPVPDSTPPSYPPPSGYTWVYAPQYGYVPQPIGPIATPIGPSGSPLVDAAHQLAKGTKDVLNFGAPFGLGTMVGGAMDALTNIGADLAGYAQGTPEHTKSDVTASDFVKSADPLTQALGEYIYANRLVLSHGADIAKAAAFGNWLVFFTQMNPRNWIPDANNPAIGFVTAGQARFNILSAAAIDTSYQKGGGFARWENLSKSVYTGGRHGYIAPIERKILGEGLLNNGLGGMDYAIANLPHLLRDPRYNTELLSRRAFDRLITAVPTWDGISKALPSYALPRIVLRSQSLTAGQASLIRLWNAIDDLTGPKINAMLTTPRGQLYSNVLDTLAAGQVLDPVSTLQETDTLDQLCTSCIQKYVADGRQVPQCTETPAQTAEASTSMDLISSLDSSPSNLLELPPAPQNPTFFPPQASGAYPGVDVNANPNIYIQTPGGSSGTSDTLAWVALAGVGILLAAMLARRGRG